MREVHHLANTYKTLHENTKTPELWRSRYCNFNLCSAFGPSAASANKLSSQGNPVWKDNPFLIIWTDTFGNEMAQGCPCHLLLCPHAHIHSLIWQYHILSVLYSRSTINILHWESALIMLGKQWLVSGSRGSAPACRSGKIAFKQAENWWPRQQHDIWVAINFQRLDWHRKEQTANRRDAFQLHFK